MGILRKIGNGLGHIFDFRVDRWLNLKLIKDNTTYYLQETKRLFSVEQPEHLDEFDDAVNRLDLSPEFISNQAKRYLYLAAFFLVCSGLLLSYGVFLILQSNLMGSLICFALTFYALTCAFRFHFWYFQIKQRKLGCSIQEWIKSFHLRLR